MAFERLRLNRGIDWRLKLSTTGNFESRFCKSIGWITCAAAKSARAKSGNETFECFPANRLRSVVSHTPTAEIECRALVYSDSAHAQIVSKVRPSAVCHLIFRDGFQPPQRALQKRCGRHQDATKAAVQRLYDTVHKTHVMEVRQP